jgi:small ligand-binding sensory domain FIST
MMKTSMRCGAALSTLTDTREAANEVARAALSQLGGAGPPDLAVVFASSHHASQFADLSREIRHASGTRTCIGCTGESIVGGDQEIEMSPAIALWLAKLPGVSMTPLQLGFERTLDGGLLTGFPPQFDEPLPAGSVLVMLGDPFTFPAEMLLERINEEHPGVPVVGGMASGAASPGENRLLINDEVINAGAVGVLVHGETLRVRTITSQGCRPIGTHFVITKAERNIIFELGGVPALHRLGEIFKTLPTRDQQLMNRGLHVGRVMSEYQDHFAQGDFLIKNVIGVDPEAGAIAIGDYVRVGQTVQFHVRDEASADADLKLLLAQARDASPTKPLGGLLFTCNGRGTRLFSVENHDASTVQQTFGEIPLAGFFAQGELGPVGGKNYIHGFTASVVLFEASETK